MKFSDRDMALLKSKGITPEQVEEQLRLHATGFPPLEVKAAAVPGNGITVLTPEQQESARLRWRQFLADGGTVCKFVPASGAASRMFKALYEFAAGDSMEAPEGSAPRAIVDNLAHLPFVDDLGKAVNKMYGTDLSQLVAERRHRDIVTAIIDPAGLNYGNLPKGLLKFHSYPTGSRTPLEEHLVEGAQTAADPDGRVNLHFTVSGAHRQLFEQKLAEVVPAVEQSTGCRFSVSLSEQKASTDTIAANPDGTPFRTPEGDLLFRPGGHGALIANLADIDAEVVFIKNIDNVVPDSRRQSTIDYKTVLAGYLVQLHDRVEELVDALDTNPMDEDVLAEAVEFMRRELSTDDERFSSLRGLELADLLRCKLDRPLRVCGMVRNEGEPGGGPYIARNPDGSLSPQILESHQIDTSTPEGKTLLQSATHFNPVDLVVYIRDLEGRPYPLAEFTDPATGFISSKSSHGRELRALELPGLWNGAMSDWSTAFVEVPASTFNPVKTVNDLLRPAHQS